MYWCPLFILLYFNNLVVFSQPNTCQIPPIGYQRGGNFDIVINQDGLDLVSDHLCLSEKAAVERIKVIDKSSLLQSSVRYIFGVNNTTTIPSSIPLATSIDINGQAAGEFWIMQIGEESGVKKLNCKLLQIDVSDRPKVDLLSCNDQEIGLALETDNPVSYYSINWGDSNNYENVNYQTGTVKITHTYTSSPTNLIEARAVYRNPSTNKTCSSKPIKITPPSIFFIRSLKSEEVGNTLSSSLQINNPNNDAIEILYSLDGGLSYNNSVSTKQNKVDIDALPKAYSCYKVKYTKNTCIYTSEPVCSIYPKVDNTSYGEVNISWNPLATPTNYTVKRSGGTPISATTVQNLYIDKKLDCGGSYNYQVFANYTNKLSMPVDVISSIVQANANFSINLESKKGLFVTINSDNKPQLNILDDTGILKYYIYRANGSNAQNFVKVDEIVGNQYIDRVDASKDTYCYMIKYEDACGNVSPASAPFCTILLEANENELFWNTPTGASNTVIKYDVNRIAPREATTSQINTNFRIDNPIGVTEKYQVEASILFIIAGKEYRVKSQSNQLDLNFATPIYLPSVFSPNQDNLNETFEALGRLNTLKSFKMQIFNKWGNIVYESNDRDKGWDGRINGEVIKSDIYVFKITYTDRFGNSFTKMGNLMLLQD